MPTTDLALRRANNAVYRARHPGREADRKRRYRLEQRESWPEFVEPNRTEAAREILRSYPYLTNAEVARKIGGDEKIVRRARKSLDASS